MPNADMYGRECMRLVYMLLWCGLIHFDLDLVSVRVADKRRKAFTARAVVYLRLGWLKASPLEGGDDVVNTGASRAQAEVLLAQIGRRRWIGGGGLKEIQDGVPGAQGYYLVSSLGSAFVLDRKAQRFAVKLLHRSQVSRNQGYVIEAFIGKHRLNSVASLESAQEFCLVRRGENNTSYH
jgi:hypothetical protein